MATYITVPDSYPAALVKDLKPWQVSLRVEKREGSNVPDGARKLTRPEGEFRYVIGREAVQVWAPDGAKYVASFPALTGCSPDEINETHRHFPVTPHHIAQFVGRGFRPAIRPVYG